MPRKLLPITIVTVQLDMDDRIKAIEEKLGIKLKPFVERTKKYRQPELAEPGFTQIYHHGPKVKRR